MKLDFSVIKTFFEDGNVCIFCGRELPKGQRVCLRCQTEADELKNSDGFVNGALYAYRYDGIIKRLIHRFKYDDEKWLIPFAAQLMADFLAKYDVCADYITHVPVHKARKKTRGYDQSEQLALCLSELTEIPHRTLLSRVKKTKAQYSLNAVQRKKNISGAFEAISTEPLAGKHVLLIDDILTSGATVSACIDALAHFGATVGVFAFSKEFSEHHKKV